jgi:hypothetical protein
VKDDGTRYYATVKGRPVARFGAGSSALLGARIDSSVEGNIAYDEGAVVAIPPLEHARFAREYGKAVRNGELREATRADHDAYLAKQKQQGERDAAELAKRRADEKAELDKASAEQRAHDRGAPATLPPPALPTKER